MNSPAKALWRIARSVLLFPVSPRAFRATAAALRACGLLHSSPNRSRGTIQRIFVSHPYSSVGDLVLLIPLLERIRSEWPDAAVDVAVARRPACLLDGVAGVNVIALDHCDDFFKSDASHKLAGVRSVFQRYAAVFHFLAFSRRGVVGHAYDLAVVPRWGANRTWPATYLGHLVNAEMTVGYSAGVDGGEISLDSLLTHAVTGGAGEHETLRNLRLLSRAGLWKENAEDEQTVNRPIRSLVRAASVARGAMQTEEPSALPLAKKKAYAVVSPGATAAFRMWPTQQLARVMQQLHEQTDLSFCIIGSGGDADVCNALEKAAPQCSASLAGKTSLMQLMTLLAEADLFLGMDSGSAHISGALGVPTVVISPFPSTSTAEHPNSPVRFQPCGPLVRVLQPKYPLAPCTPTCSSPVPHCIGQITTGEVIAAIAELLHQAQTQKGAATALPTGE